MITVNNYNQKRDSFNFKDVSSEILDVFMSVDEDFDDLLELYTDPNPENDTFREVVDNHIKLVNKYFVAEEKPKPKKSKKDYGSVLDIVITDAGGKIIASSKNVITNDDYTTIASIDRNTGKIDWHVAQKDLKSDVVSHIKGFAKAKKSKPKVKSNSKKRVSKNKEFKIIDKNADDFTVKFQGKEYIIGLDSNTKLPYGIVLPGEDVFRFFKKDKRADEIARELKKVSPELFKAQKPKPTPKRMNYSGRKVEIRPKGKKYIVWDVDSDQIFANEYFKTIESAKRFTQQNKMKLVDKPKAKSLSKVKPKAKSSSKAKSKTRSISKKVDKESVDHYSQLYKLLRRFNNFINKDHVTFHQTRLLFMAFNKSSLERKVRKSDDNANLFKKANEAVITIFDHANRNIEQAKKHGIEIDLKNTDKYKDIFEFANSKQIDIAVRLLKRFVSMQGTKPEKEKVQRLIKSIDNAIEKKKLDKRNRLYNNIAEAKKDLHEYLESIEPIDIDPIGLSGKAKCDNRVKCEGLTKSGQLKKGYKFTKGGDVKKVSKRKKKSQGLKSPEIEYIDLDYNDPLDEIVIEEKNTTVPIEEPIEKPIEKPLKQSKPIRKKQSNANSEKIISASESVNVDDFEFYNVPGAVGDFLQRVERKEKDSVVITIDGKQGAGKTTMLYQFMDSFASGGNMSLFASLEQHPKSVLTQDLKDKYITNQNRSNIDMVGDFDSLNEFYSIIEHYDIIFIDSWQKLLEQVGKINLDTDLRKKFDGKVFVVVFQQTTTGRTKGGAGIVFDGDIIIKMETGDTFADNYAYFDKNRYTQKSIDKLRYNVAGEYVYDPSDKNQSKNNDEAIEYLEF